MPQSTQKRIHGVRDGQDHICIIFTAILLKLCYSTSQNHFVQAVYIKVLW